jgi:glucose-1-phosphate cytidylyltransferase
LDRVASFLSVRPNLSYHFVTTNGDGEVTSMQDIAQARIRVNGGFFVFRRRSSTTSGTGEELVLEPFQRLIRERQLLAHEYDGFWVPMDTAKDKKRLDDLNDSGPGPGRSG